MRIVFFGSGAFGIATLKELVRMHEVVGVVSQPDRPAGRGQRDTPTPIAQFATEQHISPLLKPQDVNTPEARDAIRALDADAWVVIAFGQKLGQELLEDQFAINVHASLLPRWRGASPINAAIIAGDTTTGNTIITLADRMDAGLILAQKAIPLDPSCTASDLHDALSLLGPSLILSVLEQHTTSSLHPVEQDESLVTIARKLSKTDSWVDFTQPAKMCRSRIHGLSPKPGVRVTLDGQSLKLLRVEPADNATDASPGTLVDPSRGIVACGQGTALRLLAIQPAGKRMMEWADYARGRTLSPGLVLEGRVRAC